MPSAEHALTGLDGVEVVASVRAAPHAPERRDVIDLGSPHSPNFERLAQANADVIVGDVALHAAHRSDLGRFGGKVVLLDSSTVDGMLGSLAELGLLVGAGSEMSKRVAGARDELRALSLSRSVPVLVLFGTPGSFLVVSDRTWLGNLLETLDFENLGGEVQGRDRVPGYADVSQEKIVALRPELVLLVAHGDPRAIRSALEERMSEGGVWSGLGRSASGGVHIQDPMLFSANPGLDLPRAARMLTGLATPQAPAAQ